jgi:hypothetical protein
MGIGMAAESTKAMAKTAHGPNGATKCNTYSFNFVRSALIPDYLARGGGVSFYCK